MYNLFFRSIRFYSLLFKKKIYFKKASTKLYTAIDQKLVNSLHRLLNYEISGLDCHVITTEYRTRAHCIHMLPQFCNALVHVIYM